MRQAITASSSISDNKNNSANRVEGGRLHRGSPR
jgi:hypothetical protein